MACTFLLLVERKCGLDPRSKNQSCQVIPPVSCNKNITCGKQMLYVLNIMVRYSLIYVGTKDRQFLTFIPSFDLLFYANHSNVASMKQSIRLTRAKLYFKFIAFRVLTSVRAGATPQRMFEKWKDMVKLTLKCFPGPRGFS